MVMACPESGAVQCSGGSIIRSDNGIALTSSGVQVYGRSTSDLAIPFNPNAPVSGFELATGGGGVAEVRVEKATNGTVSSPALLLSNLGLSWDGTKERPQIIETFAPTQDRVTMAANGTLNRNATLPPPSDLAFYDFKSATHSGTQANYANNHYFPRSDPSRCPVVNGAVVACPPASTAPVVDFNVGTWGSGGSEPAVWSTGRMHEDGDIHAGIGQVDATGPGVPYPGTKGYRDFANWGLQYANLAAWTTQDTVNIQDWANLGTEHNKNRRGIVAFGEVTNPAAVPTTGTATYSGIAYGWYANSRADNPPVFRSPATITVNFATRIVTVKVDAAATFDANLTPLPTLNFTASTAMGAAGNKVANYMTGTIDNGTLKGGISGRFFGPVQAGAPAEIGGSYTLSNTTGRSVIGGFIARKP